MVAEEATKRELSLVSAMAKPRVVGFLNLGTISLVVYILKRCLTSITFSMTEPANLRISSVEGRRN